MLSVSAAALGEVIRLKNVRITYSLTIIRSHLITHTLLHSLTHYHSLTHLFIHLLTLTHSHTCSFTEWVCQSDWVLFVSERHTIIKSWLMSLCTSPQSTSTHRVSVTSNLLTFHNRAIAVAGICTRVRPCERKESGESFSSERRRKVLIDLHRPTKLGLVWSR